MVLKDKVINFLGDSITEGVGVTDRSVNRFTEIIQRKCCCKRVNNYGVGGSRIAYQFTPSEKARHDLDFCGRCWDMDKDADIVVVFGGINDYFHGDAPIGSIGDVKRTTFYGSVDYLCRTIVELYGSAVHVFLTPAHCRDDNGPSLSDKKPDNAPRLLLSEYVVAINQVANKYGFYVWDMANELKIDPKIQYDREKYTIDGIHFNDAGHAMIADTVIGLLESI